MTRTIRYQGAILRDDRILLIQQREYATGHAYWVFPGGGREPEETEEACVRREMREETDLDVAVERLLLVGPDVPPGRYKLLKTYLCKVVGGEAKPGFEPEVGAAQQYAIAAVRWFDLRDPAGWEAEVKKDSFWTFPQLQRIRAVLGYSVDGSIENRDTDITKDSV